MHVYKHAYFVAYSFPGGLGNTEISLENPVRSIEDVRLMEKLIRESAHLNSAVVTNFIELPPNRS